MTEEEPPTIERPQPRELPPDPVPPVPGSDADYLLQGKAPPLDPTDPRSREERESAAYAELLAARHTTDLPDQMLPAPYEPPETPPG